MGSVHIPADFLDLGSRRAVDLVLHRLVKGKVLRRLDRGIYEYPREHPELGTLSPDIDKIALALSGRHRIRLQPAGAYATNMLGLSEQVPAKAVFLTDGPSRPREDWAARNSTAPHFTAQYGDSGTFERYATYRHFAFSANST